MSRIRSGICWAVIWVMIALMTGCFGSRRSKHRIRDTRTQELIEQRVAQGIATPTALQSLLYEVNKSRDRDKLLKVLLSYMGKKFPNGVMVNAKTVRYMLGSWGAPGKQSKIGQALFMQRVAELPSGATLIASVIGDDVDGQIGFYQALAKKRHVTRVQTGEKERYHRRTRTWSYKKTYKRVAHYRLLKYLPEQSIKVITEGLQYLNKKKLLNFAHTLGADETAINRLVSVLDTNPNLLRWLFEERLHTCSIFGRYNRCDYAIRPSRKCKGWTNCTGSDTGWDTAARESRLRKFLNSKSIAILIKQRKGLQGRTRGRDGFRRNKKQSLYRILGLRHFSFDGLKEVLSKGLIKDPVPICKHKFKKKKRGTICNRSSLLCSSWQNFVIGAECIGHGFIQQQGCRYGKAPCDMLIFPSFAKRIADEQLLSEKALKYVIENSKEARKALKCAQKTTVDNCWGRDFGRWFNTIEMPEEFSEYEPGRQYSYELTYGDHKITLSYRRIDASRRSAGYREYTATIPSFQSYPGAKIEFKIESDETPRPGDETRFVAKLRKEAHKLAARLRYDEVASQIVKVSIMKLSGMAIRFPVGRSASWWEQKAEKHHGSKASDVVQVLINGFFNMDPDAAYKLLERLGKATQRGQLTMAMLLAQPELGMGRLHSVGQLKGYYIRLRKSYNAIRSNAPAPANSATHAEIAKFVEWAESINELAESLGKMSR